MSDPIPQKFALRKVRAPIRVGPGLYKFRVFHIYWNYRNTVEGSVPTSSRTRAKAVIRERHPEAEFFRDGKPRTTHVPKQPKRNIPSW